MRREVATKSDFAGQCSHCKGSGVVRCGAEYPSSELGQCCQHCKTGRAMAEAIAEIVVRALAGKQARVA
jgi:hypothetical protein